MLKRDLYFQAHLDDAHLRKNWVLQAFSVTRFNRNAERELWEFRYRPDGTDVWNGTDWVEIQDVEAMKPVFYADEPLSLKAGEVPNLKKDVDSTYGDVLFNWRVLVYAFGEHFDYEVGPINIGAIERKIAELMVDDPLPGEPEDESLLYVSKYLKFGQACSDLAGFTQLWVPAATPKSLQTHPDSKKLRAELLEKYKDRLHDPAIIAEIQNALVELDKEWLKGDPSMGFFMNDKQFNTARKRMFMIHGPEAGFSEGGSAELIINSLDEGWDMEKMPAMINSLRAGSYFRGALTALGGESVKFFMRIFQNTRISQKDCGTTMGMLKSITKENYKSLVGFYEVTPQGPKGLDVDYLQSKVGQTLEVRSPLYCKTGLADFCEKCMGDTNAANPMSLGAEASQIGSAFMYVMMKAAHAKELKTARLRVDSFLT